MCYQAEPESRNNILELEEEQLALLENSTINGGSPMQALGTDPQDEVHFIVSVLVKPIQFTKFLVIPFFKLQCTLIVPEHVSFVLLDGMPCS